MTRLALAGKCGRPARPPMPGCVVAGPDVATAEANSLRKRYDSAARPTPVADLPSKARRVMCRRLSVSGFISSPPVPSFLGQRLVGVQDRQADARPCGLIDGVELFVSLRLADGEQLRRRGFVR